MWLYPLPAVIAFFGWTFAFVTSGRNYLAAGILALLAGIVIQVTRARVTRTWPFAIATRAE